MTEAIDRTHSEFLARTTHVRRWLILQGEASEGGFGAEIAANVRGWALVWMCAAAETFWTSFLTEFCREFTSGSARVHRRRLKAQAIYFSEKFFSTASKDLESRWKRSAALVEDVVRAQRTTEMFSIPYDGKTVRPIHVELFCEIFEIAGSPFPSLVHRQSLETLANDRNKVAHGEMLPSTLGGLRTKDDVVATLLRLEESFEHVFVSGKSIL